MTNTIHRLPSHGAQQPDMADAGSPLVNLTSRLHRAGIDLPHDFSLQFSEGSADLRCVLAYLSTLADHCDPAPDPITRRESMLGMLILAMNQIPGLRLPSDRHFVVDALERLGLTCPESYAALVAKSERGEQLDNMGGWVLLTSPAHHIATASRLCGQTVLPFAHAPALSKQACFSFAERGVCRLFEIDLAVQPGAQQPIRDLENFDCWLTQAIAPPEAPAPIPDAPPADFMKLSRLITRALRHRPASLKLELDQSGWVPVPRLLAAVGQHNPAFKGVDEAQLEHMIAMFNKQRLEIADGKIRAIYGHSVAEKIVREPVAPPTTLFHGTSREAAAQILSQGLKPMGRQSVHLSADAQTARGVGRRKDQQPVMLSVRAHDAHLAGVLFYRGRENIWLADTIPPEFVEAPADFA